MMLNLVSSLVDVLAGLSQVGVELVSLLVELLVGLSEVGLERVLSPLDVMAGPSNVGFKRVSLLLDVLAGLSQVGLEQVSLPLDVLAGAQSCKGRTPRGPKNGTAKPSKSRSLTKVPSRASAWLAACGWRCVRLVSSRPLLARPGLSSGLRSQNWVQIAVPKSGPPFCKINRIRINGLETRFQNVELKTDLKLGLRLDCQAQISGTPAMDSGAPRLRLGAGPGTPEQAQTGGDLGQGMDF